MSQFHRSQKRQKEKKREEKQARKAQKRAERRTGILPDGTVGYLPESPEGEVSPEGAFPSEDSAPEEKRTDAASGEPEDPSPPASERSGA